MLMKRDALMRDNKKEVLTGIRYYQYHLFAAVACLGYASYHYVFGSFMLFLVTACASLLMFGLIVCRMTGKHSRFFHDSALLLVVATIFAACYFLGVRGAIWLFPLVIGLFFNYAYRSAFLISLATVACALTLLAHQVELSLVLRFLVPLLVTMGFAYLYRVTIEKEQQALLKEASEDYLTGICNRRSFSSWLDRAVSAHAGTQRFLVVFYLDIDDFKQINDTYGHDYGDRVLQEITRRLKCSTRATDKISWGEEHQFARIAGDEFVIAATNIAQQQDIDAIAQRLLQAVNAPLQLDGFELRVCGSIGVAVCQNGETTPDGIMRDADAAMFRSKQLGKNRITYFDQSIAAQILEKQMIARGLEEALRQGEFVLNFMPIFSGDAHAQMRVTGVEVLIRCQSEGLAGIGPDKYIPVAEESGLIMDIDVFVIEQAFKYFSTVQENLPDDFRLAINISAKELYNDYFPQRLDSLASAYRIQRHKVELEITETSLVACDDKVIATLQNIKALGFELSLDDFGTGYTAFNQLQHYPVDTLKIDRSFVWNITDQNPAQETMVNVILSLAKLYDVKIVAEGVENQVQLDYLVHAGCDFFQGFYLAKPMSWDAFQKRFLNASEESDKRDAG